MSYLRGCSHKASPSLTPALPSPALLCCALQGVHLAVGLARQVYAQLGTPEALQLFVDKAVGHECTPPMWRETRLWLDKHLHP